MLHFSLTWRKSTVCGHQLRLLLQNSKEPLFLTVSELKANYRYNSTVESVRRYTYKNDNCNYVAVSKPYTLPSHIQARKRWAYVHKDWDIGHSRRFLLGD